MVDVIIRHWVGLIVNNEDGPDRFGYTVVDKMTLFYEYVFTNIMSSLTPPIRCGCSGGLT